ncbi:MAG TPA: L,D-transpeptidase family protein, partial [Acidimicrobiales bacterium]|nr:L,D-transpeptidase family protein [Acidimicrobiales bacterium]
MAVLVMAGASVTGADYVSDQPLNAATSDPVAAAVVDTTTSTTAAPVTTTTVTLPAAPAPGFGNGDAGPDVMALEQRLVALKYDPGNVDGTFDWATHYAVMAFQKVQGIPRTGRATPDVMDMLTRVGAPGPMLPAGGATRVEVDLKRQMLQLYVNGELNRVLSVSTGSGKRYCVNGDCATAVTPGGSFKITRRIPGWRTSRLGKLYNPLYFNGGIAIHGAPSVPAYPASHGCVRIPMHSARWFPDTVPNGTPVYVIGGSRAAVPFNEPAPGEA